MYFSELHGVEVDANIGATCYIYVLIVTKILFLIPEISKFLCDVHMKAFLKLWVKTCFISGVVCFKWKNSIMSCDAVYFTYQEFKTVNLQFSLVSPTLIVAAIFLLYSFCLLFVATNLLKTLYLFKASPN